MNFERIQQLTVNASGFEFNGADFAAMAGPGVYVVLGLDDSPHYIGRARSLLARISQRTHRRREHIESAKRILIYPCVDYSAAIELEEILIAGLRPLLNINKPSAHMAAALAGRLGVTTMQARFKYIKPALG